MSLFETNFFSSGCCRSSPAARSFDGGWLWMRDTAGICGVWLCYDTLARGVSMTSHVIRCLWFEVCCGVNGSNYIYLLVYSNYITEGNMMILCFLIHLLYLTFVLVLVIFANLYFIKKHETCLLFKFRPEVTP